MSIENGDFGISANYAPRGGISLRTSIPEVGTSYENFPTKESALKKKEWERVCAAACNVVYSFGTAGAAVASTYLAKEWLDTYPSEEFMPFVLSLFAVCFTYFSYVQAGHEFNHLKLVKKQISKLENIGGVSGVEKKRIEE